MQTKMSVRNSFLALTLGVLAGGVTFLGTAAFIAPGNPVLAADQNSDLQIQQQIQNQLKNKKFKGVTVNVQNGSATLSGEVDLYAYKADALKRAKKVRGVKDVQDNIAVAGPTVSDSQLEQKLLSGIQVDRIGFGQVFNAISVNVRNGVATLGGHALDPVSQQSAVGLTANTPGVKGVVNKIQVDPVSPMDNSTRRAAYRAIYGYSPLRKYEMVPSRPIRISIQNGNMTLYGSVDSEMDKNLVYQRAMQVPNVFHVTNNLVVPGEQREQPKKK